MVESLATLRPRNHGQIARTAQISKLESCGDLDNGTDHDHDQREVDADVDRI